MAETAEKTQEVEIVPYNGDVIEDMILRLKMDVETRDEQNVVRSEAQSLVSDANERIKSTGQALSIMTEYMSEEQIEIVNSLNLYHYDLEPSPERGRLNEVAQLAFDILSKAKGGEMTNEALHKEYEKKTDEEEPLNYSKFNVKIRSLFSSQRLIREVPEDASSSREHIIKINGFKAGK